jgi:hypothetical protein
MVGSYSWARRLLGVAATELQQRATTLDVASGGVLKEINLAHLEGAKIDQTATITHARADGQLSAQTVWPGGGKGTRSGRHR